jgi:hypothetical protein
MDKLGQMFFPVYVLIIGSNVNMRTSPSILRLLFVMEVTVRSLQPFLDVISGCNDWVFRRPIL